jgi:hypothetical protein
MLSNNFNEDGVTGQENEKKRKKANKTINTRGEGRTKSVEV